MREPTDIPSVQELPDNDPPFFCSMCTVHFDSESFELAGNQCPGCKDMAEAQEKMQKRGYRGAL